MVNLELVKSTYLNFGNDLTPLQRGRVETLLDDYISFKGKHMTNKEWVYYLLTVGYVPSIQENYTYYSSRTDAYTKPRTLYKLEYEDGGYYEVSKTLFNFANHILVNNFLDPATINNFINNELHAKSIKLKQAEQEAEQQRVERARADEERKRQHLIKREEWRSKGSKLLNANVVGILKESLDEIWNELKTRFPQTSRADADRELIARFTEQLGNEEFIKSNVSYLLLNSQSSLNNINNALYKNIYKRLFKVEETDNPITLTSKVKAFYEGREYKGSKAKPVYLETFYIFKDGEYKPTEGERKKIGDLTCFLRKHEGMWIVTESRSGMSLGSSNPNKIEAVNQAKDKVEKLRDKIEQAVNRQIEKNGISPIYLNKEGTKMRKQEVFWDDNMEYCVGDAFLLKETFIRLARTEHIDNTGEDLPENYEVWLNKSECKWFMKCNLY